jgi:hypothetical protein
MAYDNYKKIETPAGAALHHCPVCGFAAEIWRYSETADSPTTTAVCCGNSEKFGPQDGFFGEGCLLYMPPNDFYRNTIKDAIAYWNEYADALESFRRKQHWELAKVLRENAEVKL